MVEFQNIHSVYGPERTKFVPTCPVCTCKEYLKHVQDRNEDWRRRRNRWDYRKHKEHKLLFSNATLEELSDVDDLATTPRTVRSEFIGDIAHRRTPFSGKLFRYKGKEVLHACFYGTCILFDMGEISLITDTIDQHEDQMEA